MTKRRSFKAKIKPAKPRRVLEQEASRPEFGDRRSRRLQRKNHYRQTGEIT